MENTKFEDCFSEEPNKNLERTFRRITYIMINKYKLNLPKWWELKFPAKF